MKKFYVVLLLIVASLTFAACGGSETSSEEDVTATLLDEYVGGELTALMDAVDDLGYNATYYNQGEDWTDILPLDETMAEDYIVGELDEAPDAKTVDVTMKFKSNAEQEEAESALEEKLEEGAAWSAANKYGKEQYGDSFDLNYIKSKITASAEDADTWFLKAGCEVNGEKMTCEAKVTGTTDAPEVTSFDVY